MGGDDGNVGLNDEGVVAGSRNVGQAMRCGSTWCWVDGSGARW